MQFLPSFYPRLLLPCAFPTPAEALHDYLFPTPSSYSCFLNLEIKSFNMYLQDREVLAARTLTLPGPGGQADATSSSSTFSAKSTPIVTPTSLLPHSFVAQTSVSTSDSTPTEGAVSKSASSGKSSNKGPIIGGVIGGVVFLAICAGLLWFCLRRRRKQKEMDEMARGLTPMLGSPANGTEKFAMDNSPDLGEDGERQSGGVFAPFGGQCKPS